MARSKILGIALGASLLLGIEPTAMAAPIAAPPPANELSAISGHVTKTFLGIERRHARRVERRAYRHERREARRGYRYERREIRRHGY